MDAINAMQVSFLLNISKESAFYRVMKHSGRSDEAEELRLAIEKHNKDNPGKKERKLSSKECRTAEISIQKFSEGEGIDIQGLIDSINKDFAHSWECTQYLLKKMGQKWKPATSGHYPLSLTIPNEISSLMTEEGHKKVLDFMTRNCVARTTKDKDGNPLTVIYKI